MGRYSGKLLLSDLDGTLLDNGGIVSEDNKIAIREFIENGGLFGVATGRSHQNFRKFMDGVDINAPCILYNGCALYDSEKDMFLDAVYLPVERLKEWVEYCLYVHPEVMMHIYTPDSCHIVSSEEKGNPGIFSDHQPALYSGFEEVLNKQWLKILAYGKADELKEIEKKLIEMEIEDDVHHVYSSDVYLEILPPTATKGFMLEKLRGIMGSNMRIYAVGDYMNDLEMITSADVGIAMGNANQKIKDIADIVTVSNEESAIAEIIRNLI
ncbi:Cof-type HAD-IIB family hydrolase [Youngiibacter multivorans]|uniref:Cof subfamily protein (Haloacid dehalogenase superfamily) n=1 Tax=Youngiibacter multivorans TaxID=937251 RepID=A0ABS4G6L7_9CLOT|nr:Cof-type HAD-IIB family hydrolase [Youngiibacter multivorans]MBP1919925.1 Cof subfamily protein (haloacid dehalogenase superfamily) [Youngiibacter multivorans]